MKRIMHLDKFNHGSAAKTNMMFFLTAIGILLIFLDNLYAERQSIEIPPGEYRIVYYDKDTKQIKTMEAREETNGLTDKAIEAVIKSPKWIRKDLLQNLIELYKIPINAGVGAQLAFADVSGDNQADLIVKSADGTIQAFIAPYWKSASPADKADKNKVNKFEDVVYHDVTGDGLPDKVFISKTGQVCFQRDIGSNKQPNYLTYDHNYKRMFDIKPDSRNISPAFGDINGDKITDLVIGNKEGEISVYYGPDFKKSDLLPIKVNGYSKPVLCDFNKDGNPDLIVGCKDGKIFGFSGPGFARPDSHLGGWKEEKTLFNDINVKSHSAPALCDIDKDGDIDLCIGNGEGKIFLFKKTQDGYTLGQDIFNNAYVDAFSTPAFTDINGDGKSDLVVGDIKGDLHLFLAPEWNPVTSTLLTMGKEETFIAPCFYDIDTDGAVELAVGCGSGRLLYFKYENGNWQETNSWKFYPSTGIESTNNYYERYYPEQETLLGMNDNNTLSAYADILNNVKEQYLDEVAFSIAHVPSEILRVTHKLKNENILVENAQMIYKLAGSLPYVKIEEKEDYTTLAYAVEKDVFKPIPRDLYYWWIVHPRIYWEIPAKIDASYWMHDWEYYGIDEEKWTRDTGGLKIYQHTSNSHFWRSFLPYDTKYGPSLFSRLKDAPTAMHAIYRISQFIHEESPGGIVSYGRRSADIQPLMIYMKAYGSCGEQAISYCAALRTMLIPAAITTCAGEDHAWSNYWFNGNWYSFGDAVNMGLPSTGAGDTVSIITRHWGNDFSDDLTNSVGNIIPGGKKGYADTTELNIRVVDSLGRGIDGAMVTVRSHAFSDRRNSHHGYTDSEGNIKFNVGTNTNVNGGILVDVISPFGAGGFTKLIPAKDKKYNYTFKLPGIAGYYKNDVITKASKIGGKYEVKANFRVVSEYQYPESIATGIRERSDSEFAKELKYYGTRKYFYPNQEMNGVYAYLADRKTIKKLIDSGIMETNHAVERKPYGEINKNYDNLEDIALVLFNKNSLRTNVELEYELNIYTKEPNPPEITLEKCPEVIKTGEGFVFNGACRDDIRIAGFKFSYDGGKNWQDIISSVKCEKDVWQYEWNTAHLLPRTYRIKFRIENDAGLYSETPAVTITLNSSERFRNIKIYQDNPENPLPESSWMLGPFKIDKDIGAMEIETRSKEKFPFDMDMFLFSDKNGNRKLDGNEEEFSKSATPTENEHIFENQVSTQTVYWLYLQGWKVPLRNEQIAKMNKYEILNFESSGFKKQYQNAYLDMELSFIPRPVLVHDLTPVGTVYYDKPIEISGMLVSEMIPKTFSIKLDGVDITKSILWKDKKFTYRLGNIKDSETITHTVKVSLSTDDGYKDEAEWFFVTEPRPDVTVRYELDKAKEWLTIIADVKEGAEVEYIRFKVVSDRYKKQEWEYIPKDTLKVRKYVWRYIWFKNNIIVEYKTAKENKTIVKSFKIDRDRVSYGKQLEDIVTYPVDKSELNNPVVSIQAYFHERIGVIEEVHIWLDGKEVKFELSDYAWGKVATYIPEKPYAIGTHSVVAKVKTNEGKEIEKYIEFDIIPIR